ncbi:hypothetical protein BGW36DRAFT_427242 [Talaromyces proteolyticus]|uniref:Transcription factor domain-containing protein n=1 Tax=Talaromyces proteolyticus TaxID=1131652 RepID=A0AAD4Q0I1_9EURO|nr:uncharacterized protein BGW36DRAFT_427242 [Talaromyces proteolyticus]KAH8697276.1 hypothetical protein BGW36DRAFT_427242 [Talaromyces proteolyticus]
MGTGSPAADGSSTKGSLEHEEENLVAAGQSPAQSTSSSSSQSFEFVLVTDEGSRRQVRRHAMRQYMRQRRLDGIARLASSRAPIPGRHHQAGDSSWESMTQEEPENEAHQRPDNAIVPIRTRRHHNLSSSSPGPSNILLSPGAGGIRDPFNSYPIPISDNDHRLINHYVVTYPAMMYKLSNKPQKNPMMEIFQQFALKDRIPFQAMLAIASKHLASVEGQSESLQSLAHKTQALQLINRNIRDTTDDQIDNFIYAVATMAVIEKWSKDPSIERMHIKGLTLMIRRRGGMRVLKAQKPFLEQVVYWVDFSCAAKAIVGASLPWTGSVPDVPPERFRFWLSDQQPRANLKERGCSDYLKSCEDFLAFFRCLHAAQKALLEAPCQAPSTTESRRMIPFDRSSRLYCTLTALPDYDRGIRDVRFIDEYTRMACLLYLNIALYECYRKQQNFDLYLAWIHSGMQQFSAEPSVSSLMWLILDNGGYARGDAGDAGERSWLVSRMLRVVKRLEWTQQGTLWDQLRLVMLNFITTQQECGLGSDMVGEYELVARQKKLGQMRTPLWDEDEMRREILGNLYDGSSFDVSNSKGKDLE